MKDGFCPIELEDYLDRHMGSNPSDDRDLIKKNIKKMISFHKEGVRCHCGNEIWVIGSAIKDFPQCFFHVTGEARPDDDFEIIF